MKNKGVVISIGLILIIGVLVTVGTRRFVTDGKSQITAAAEVYQSSQPAGGEAVSEDLDGALPEAAALSPKEERQDNTAAEETGGGKAGTEPGPHGAGESAAEAPARDEAAIPRSAVVKNSKDLSADQPSAAAPAAGESDDTAVSEAMPYSIISPLTGSAESSEKSGITVTEEDYKKRLQDVDSRIRTMKESGVVPNTDTCKNMAEFEYRLWDNELNAIYKDVINGMKEEEAELLRKEERLWMKDRDETARKAASKYSGGSIESMEYTASLAESTRSRAYQLLEDYGDYLPVVYTIKESGGDRR